MKPKRSNPLFAGFFRKNILATSVVLSFGLGADAMAQSISVNFGANQSSSSITESGKNSGAIPVAGNRWNNTTINGGGTLANLIDGTGAITPASVTWTAQNTWQSGSTGATATSENGDLTKGYLDDSGSGWTVNLVSPYLLNNIYAIHATDQGNPATMSAVSFNGVFYKGNGTVTIPAAGPVDSWSATNWSNADTLTESANFVRVNSQPQVSLAGLNSSPGRSAIAGLQIENAYAGSLAYWDLDGNTPGAGGGTGPIGVWNSANTNWSSSAAGDLATGIWSSGNAAVFSAGTTATGAYTVLVQGAQSADAVWAKNGTVTLGDGGLGAQLSLTGTALLRGDTALTVEIPVSATNLTTAGNVALNSSANSISGLATIYGTTTLGANQSFGSLAGGGTLALGTRTLTVGSDNTDSTFSGLITGTASLNKTGTGRLTLLNNVSGFTGTTTVSGGVLRLANASGAGSIGGTLSPSGTGTVEFFRNDTAQVGIANPFTGNGTLSFLGTNVSNQSQYDLSGATSGFTGTVNIDDARLRIDPGDFDSASSITVASGGQAWMQGGTHAESYVLNGNGWSETAGQLGAMRLENGANITGPVTVSTASRVVAYSGASGTISGALSGSGNLEVNFNNASANGTVNLNNTSGYLGDITLSGGRLNLTSPATNSAVTLATGTSLGGEGTVESLTTLGTSTLFVDGSTNPGAFTCGPLTLGGVMTVNLTSLPAPGGPVRILNYTGADPSLANFALANTGVRGAAFTATGGTVELSISNTSLVWTGAGGANWDVLTTTNWSTTPYPTLTASSFATGDTVTFGEGPAGDQTVNLSTTVQPSSITFSNTATKYTVNGTGTIAGSTGVTKSGSGNVDLGGTNNSYSGAVSISGGVLKALTASALGAASGTTAITAGTLDLNGLNFGSETLNVQGTGVAGQAAVYNGSTTAQATMGPLTLTGNATLGGATSANAGAINSRAMTLTGYTLTLSSGRLSPGGNSITGGEIVAQSGSVVYQSGNPGVSTATLTLKAGATLDFRDSNSTSVASVCPISLDGGTISNGGATAPTSGNGGGAQTTFSNAITVTTNGGTLNPNNTAFALNLIHTGALSGTGALQITGGRGMDLRGDVSGYSGTVTVSSSQPLIFNGNANQVFGGNVTGGSLVKNGTNSLTMSGTVAPTGTLTHNAGVLTFSGGSLNVPQVNVAGNAVSQQLTFNETVTTRYLNLGEGGGNSGRINQTGGTVTLNSGGAGIRIGHWNNNANPGSVYNLSGGILDATALAANAGSERIVNIGWDGQGDMIVGGGAGSATLKAFGIQLDANGNGGGAAPSTGNMTLTISANGTVEVGAGNISAPSVGDGVFLNGGTLRATAASTWGAAMTSNPSTSSVLDTNGFAVTASNVLAGSGNLTKTGLGTLQLSGTNTFTGGVAVNGGKLFLGNTPVSSVSVDTGGTIQTGTPSAIATSTVNSLAMNGGTAQFRVNYPFGDRFVVSGTNTFTVPAVSSILVDLASGGEKIMNGDKIPLIDYNGDPISGADFAKLSATLSSTNPHYSGQLVSGTDSDPTAVAFEFVTAGNITWTGGASGTWDEGALGTSNWTLDSDSSVTKFYNQDQVTFNDDGLTPNPVVTLAGTIEPLRVEVSHISGTYTFQGSPISGGGSLVKINGGDLLLLNDNTYTGATYITGGTVTVGSGGTTGTIGGAGTINVSAGATLAFNRSDAQTLSRTVTGGGLVLQNGINTLTMNAGNNVCDITINSGTLAARGGGWATSFAANRTITVNAPGILDTTTHALGGLGGATRPGNIVINEDAIWKLNNEQQLPNIAVTMTAGIINGPGEVRGGGTIVTEAHATKSSVINAPLSTGNGGITFNVGDGAVATDLSVTGNIVGGNPINKTGAGTMVPSGNNTHTGGTGANGGVLVIATIADAGGVGGIGTGYLGIANDGTFRYTGTGTETTARNLWIDTGTETKTIEVASGTADITFSGTGGNINKPFRKTGPGSLTIADVMNVGTTVTVDGGKLTLGGTNLYTGDTVVNATGTLVVDGDSILDAGRLDINGTGQVQVSNIEVVDTLWIDGVQMAAGTYGATGSGASNIDNARFAGTGMVQVTTNPPNGYVSWANQIPNAADRDRADDPDSDGFTNLQEFLFGTSPIVNNGSLVTTTASGGNLVITWLQRENGATYVLKESQTMAVGTWAPSDATPAADPNQSGVPTDYDRFRAVIPITNNRSFFRVEGTEN